MISVRQNVDVYEIKFKYDPTLVQLVKLVPGRVWHSEDKMWTIPLSSLGMFLNQIKGTMYEEQVKIESEEHIDENAELEHSTPIPNYNVSKVPFLVKEGFKPYDHQIDFMKWSLYRENVQHNMHGFILADTMGLGKTVETLNLANVNKMAYRFKHCLIICCVNPAKYHWQRDIEEHSRGKFHPYILGTRIRKNGTLNYVSGSKEKLEDLTSFKMYGPKGDSPLPYFIIMNIEGIRHKKGRTYPIADAIIDLVNKGKISMIAVDEVHKNTSPSSLQGKQLLRIKKMTGTKCMWIPITGTPIVSRPTDVFLPLKLIDGHNFTSYYTWCQKFCVYGGFGNHEIIAYKNIPYLKSLLEKNMIRRLKEDVLDLPDKIYYTEYVENTKYQEALYNEVVQGIISNRGKIISSMNPLAQFLRLRQVNGSPELVDNSLTIDSTYTKYNAKLQRLLDILEDVHERKEKVIIFSNWVEPLRTLYRFVHKKYNVACYTGTMKQDERENEKKRFIEDPDCTVILGTIGALGTMHTLTVANNVIFYDEPWNATDKEQAEDRVHRIGTFQSVNIYTIITKGTVDERVHDIIFTKSGVSKYIVDGSLDIHSNPELFDLLLSDTISKSASNLQ